MNKLIWVMAAVALVASACKGGASSSDMKTLSDSVSYALGSNLGKEMKENEATLNPEMIAAGYKDGMEGKIALTDEAIQKVMMAFSKSMQEKQVAAAKAKGSAAIEKGAAFRAEKEKEGFKKTASGLLYRAITEGTGKAPAGTSTVRVHYEGKLIDGKVFDSSYERGEPIEFGLDGVIPGWTEGLQLMKEGGKYELVIPSELAYGERGAGKDIGPNETLFFTVELIKVVK